MEGKFTRDMTKPGLWERHENDAARDAQRSKVFPGEAIGFAEAERCSVVGEKQGNEN